MIGWPNPYEGTQGCSFCELYAGPAELWLAPAPTVRAICGLAASTLLMVRAHEKQSRTNRVYVNLMTLAWQGCGPSVGTFSSTALLGHVALFSFESSADLIRLARIEWPRERLAGPQINLYPETRMKVSASGASGGQE